MPSRRRRFARLRLLAAPLTLCALLPLVSALSNVGLPTRSTVLKQLIAVDKARLEEAALGDAVWPGWAAADIAFIVYNEGYAFLVGYPAEAGDPPTGRIKVPQGTARGDGLE